MRAYAIAVSRLTLSEAQHHAPAMRRPLRAVMLGGKP